MTRSLQEYVPKKTIPFSVEIRFHPDLSYGEKIFLTEIQSMTENGEAYCFSSRKLAQLFDVSHQTIINWVKNLTKMGLLKVDCNFDSPYNKIVIKGVNKL